MMKTLVAWIGSADIKASRGEQQGFGPILQAMVSFPFEKVTLLANQHDHDIEKYREWIYGQSSIIVEIEKAILTSPTNFSEIYSSSSSVLKRLVSHNSNTDLFLHISPGTPMMAAVWIILAKTKYQATLLESSVAHGVRVASVPLDMTAELVPDLLIPADRRLITQSELTTDLAPAFSSIIQASDEMQRLLRRAERCAVRSVPVLIEGESGTGKELLARAVHGASPRASKPFIVLNCGAMPFDLIESSLFGHERGAFTGAVSARAGAFELADGGTLFLDEIGELPLEAQVKLLRALQEGEVQRIGADRPRRVDVRVVAATNRALVDEVSKGRFREDLFYRLAVAVLNIPPIRQRGNDLGLLVDRLLGRINVENSNEPNFQEKKLSQPARNLLLAHHWPGNVRELNNTLLRAVIWSDNQILSDADIREALLLRDPPARSQIEFVPGTGANLPAYIGEIARQALESALKISGGNRAQAARIVGLPSRQTFDNWLSRYSGFPAQSDGKFA